MRSIAYFFRRYFLELLFLASAVVAGVFAAADIELLIATRTEMIGPMMIAVPPFMLILAVGVAALHRRFNPGSWPWHKPSEES